MRFKVGYRVRVARLLGDDIEPPIGTPGVIVRRAHPYWVVKFAFPRVPMDQYRTEDELEPVESLFVRSVKDR